MTHTRYTDPSGYDDATVSTAADQVRIVDRAMRLPAFASIVATPSATLPVAGTVHNTNTLLGHDGFVGVKTGSDNAAGGCFAFRAIRWIDGKRTTITGVVLGQPGDDQVAGGPRGRRRHGPPHRRSTQRWPVAGQRAVANATTTDGRDSMRRTLRPLATLAMFAPIVAGCSNGSAGAGSSGGDGTGATAGAAGSGTAHEKAVAFAQCMRANGISAFPDPDATGELTIEGIANGSAVDTSSAAFTQTFERVQGPGAGGVRGQMGRRSYRRSAGPRGPQSLVEQVREPGEGFVDVERETEAATGLERDESVEGGADDAGGVNRVVRLETVAA